MSIPQQQDPVKNRSSVEEQRPANGHTSPRGTNVNDPPKQLIAVEPLRKHEMQPSYAQDTGIDPSANAGIYGTFMNGLGSIVGTLGAIPCCLCFPSPYKEVQQGHVGLVSRFGAFYKSVDPGLTKINPLTEQLRSVNVQISVLAIPSQTVMTRDNVNVSIDSVIYWHTVNPYKAAFGVMDIRTALVERAQSTLRQIMGARALQSVITEREEIAREVEEILETVAASWGVQVESILIKDIVFSQELQQSLSSAAQAKRIGESRVIAAKAEVDSARLMREAADILSSPAAIQIRQLDALQNMAKSSGSKVIFVPMSLQGMGSLKGNALSQNGENINDMSAGSSGGQDVMSAIHNPAMMQAISDH